MRNTYKCAYNKCKFNGIINTDEAIKDENKYYHPECLKEKQNKSKIREIFLDKINPEEVVSYLNRVISDIVDNKNISSEFLLYALCYMIRHELKLNHAAGLYYVINDDKIKKSYLEIKAKTKVSIDKETIKTAEEVTFKIKPKTKGWNNILG